jgi:N-acetylmuramoyl-L-alanine amidase
MSSSHTVQQGEHIAGIAHKYGFRTYQVIWNHARNAELKKKRVNPNVLFPGDVLFIPDKQPKIEQRSTTEMYTFKLKLTPLKLSVVVRGRDGKPLPDTDVVLELDGETFNLKTDGDGKIERPISPDTVGGTLKVPSLQIESPIRIGHLDPVDELSGKAGRLANLGYYRGPFDPVDEAELASAVEEFQCDHGLAIDGDCGPQTQAKLKEIHGC